MWPKVQKSAHPYCSNSICFFLFLIFWFNQLLARKIARKVTEFPECWLVQAGHGITIIINFLEKFRITFIYVTGKVHWTEFWKLLYLERSNKVDYVWKFNRQSRLYMNDFQAMLTLPGKFSGEDDFGIFGNARNVTKWTYRNVLTVCKHINQIL